jgi:hypothetical protein
LPLPAPGLVARYGFHNNLLDSSGNGHTATSSGTRFVPDRFGVANRALAFDGVNDSVCLPDEAAFDGPEFTVLLILRIRIASAPLLVARDAAVCSVSTTEKRLERIRSLVGTGPVPGPVSPAVPGLPRNAGNRSISWRFGKIHFWHKTG